MRCGLPHVGIRTRDQLLEDLRPRIPQTHAMIVGYLEKYRSATEYGIYLRINGLFGKMYGYEKSVLQSKKNELIASHQMLDDHLQSAFPLPGQAQ